VNKQLSIPLWWLSGTNSLQVYKTKGNKVRTRFLVIFIFKELKVKAKVTREILVIKSWTRYHCFTPISLSHKHGGNKAQTTN
jgi:hypothetical protein